jgi:2-dehydro-3-deoxygluconokinase
MIICFGEIMLRLTPPNNHRLIQATSLDIQYGGSEANVAVSLAQLGRRAAYVSRVPDTALGRAALSELNRYGVDTTPSVFGGDRLGVYFLEMGAGSRGTKVIYDRAHSGMASLKAGHIDWQKILSAGLPSGKEEKGVNWFHWSGITPAISQSAAEATLEAVQMAKQMGLMVSCDLNYRANLWQYGKQPSAIMPELLRGCDVMLGDGDTIDLYFGIKGKDYAAVFDKTFAAFPNLSYIAMTARKAFHASHNAYKGFLHDGKKLYESREYDMPAILDRIGGGDAFMAGLIYGLTQVGVLANDLTLEQYAVEFATAAATLKHYVHGDFNLSRQEDVAALMAGNSGGRVSR